MFRQSTIGLALAVALILTAVPLRAGAPDSLWHRTYGDTLNDFGNSVTVTAEGYYVTTGKMQIYDAEADKVHTDVIVVKTDANGGTAWVRTYGGPEQDSGRSVIQNSLGQYVVAGFTESFGVGGWDMYLLVLDQAGDTLWTRTYGLPGGDEIAYCVRQTSDGGYLLVGETETGGDEDVYLVRVDAAGDTLWTRTYGGPGYHTARDFDELPYGGFIIVGTTLTTSMDVYLLRTDAAGDTLWTNAYNFGLNDYGLSVDPISYWAYIVTGYVESALAPNYNVLLMQVHHTGSVNWSRYYGGMGNDTGTSVQVVPTGGYVIAGITDSFGAGYDDMYLIRTDGNGDTLWTTTYGGVNSDWALQVEEASEGGYVLAGLTTSFGNGAFDIYLVKTGTDVAGVQVGPDQSRMRLAVSAVPNPATSTVAITYTLPSAGDVTVAIYDLLGREVRRLGAQAQAPGMHTITWDRANERGRAVQPGVYFCRVQAAGQIATGKITVVE